MKTKKISPWLLGILFLIPVLASVNGLAESLDRWEGKNLFSRGIPFRISYGNGLFVAVGEAGALYTSSDGETWTWRSSGTTQSLKDVCYGGGIFLVVGEGGIILSSPDGGVWTPRKSGTGYDLNGVGYGKGTFVAVGDGGAILASSDGLTWSSRESGTHQGLNKVAFGKDTFVAAGRNGTLLTSPDGAVWTPQSSGTHGHLDGIAYGKDTFVAVGEAILTSPDSKAWTERKAGTSHRIFGVAYGTGFFAAGADNGEILISPDGSVWTLKDSGTHLTLFAIAHGKERFLASGEGGILLVSEPLPSPQIAVSSTSLDFGSVHVGDSSFTNLTISNSGSANLIIRQMTFTGDDALDFNTRDDTCTGATLTSSRNCSVQIVFSPRFTGSKSATLSISSNDPDTPTQTVSLNGSGTNGGAVVSSGSSGFFCFFSSSVRGTGHEDHLKVLRKFRDVILLRSYFGRTLVNFYYQHSPSLARLLVGHEFLRRAVAIGLVPPLAGIAHLTLYTSPKEKAILFLLMIGAMTLAWRLIRRSKKNRRKPISTSSTLDLAPPSLFAK